MKKLKKSSCRLVLSFGMMVSIICGGVQTIEESSRINLDDYSKDVVYQTEKIEMKFDENGYAIKQSDQERLNQTLYMNGSVVDSATGFNGLSDNSCIVSFKKYDLNVNDKYIELGEGVYAPELGISQNWNEKEMMKNLDKETEANVKEEITLEILKNNLIKNMIVLLLVSSAILFIFMIKKIPNVLNIAIENMTIITIAIVMISVIL